MPVQPSPDPAPPPTTPGMPGSTTPAAEAPNDTALRTELGAAIRRLRKERGLTLVQLAKLAGLSHPFLSQLERGLTRPSMPSLHRIARALDTTQQALFVQAVTPATSAEPGNAIRVTRAADEDGASVANNGGVARMLGTAPLQLHPVEYRGMHADFQDYYEHPGDEFLYVVDGEIEVELRTPTGHRIEHLGPGDSLTYPGGTPHRWRAFGDRERVRILAVQNAPGADGRRAADRAAQELPHGE
ncbi:helix-turn-helix domain-containing protein [Streptomyces sp. NPDC087859]|uniref:helix-turn-helix domain-containing protein n=1 Tax=Streptomyces sp. NPDC087859 TaxID=3365812 RepID=UPI0037FA7973